MKLIIIIGQWLIAIFDCWFNIRRTSLSQTAPEKTIITK